MKTFIARQPLFDRQLNVVGYELLFRNSSINEAHFVDDYNATLEVIRNLIVNFGVRMLTEKKRFFINFDEVLIQHGAPDIFRPENLVIEVLEHVEVSDSFIKSLLEYQKKGYLIALDDFCFKPEKMELIKIADIIKVDFRTMDHGEIKNLVRQVKPYNPVLLAEKVETKEEFEFAREEGFGLFQGYFLEKPTVMESKEIPSIPSVYVELIKELSSEKVEFERVANIIKHDTNLTYSFLKLVNSAAYYTNSKTTSVEKALVRLGFDETKRMIYISLLKKLVIKGVPDEIVSKSLRRGRFAELLATGFGMEKRKGELFILGLFSLINIILKAPMQRIVKELPLSEDVSDALVGKTNELTEIMTLILNHERGDMKALEERQWPLNMSFKKFIDYYVEALVWSDQII